jgi:hypothetical protein
MQKYAHPPLPHVITFYHSVPVCKKIIFMQHSFTLKNQGKPDSGFFKIFWTYD